MIVGVYGPGCRGGCVCCSLGVVLQVVVVVVQVVHCARGRRGGTTGGVANRPAVVKQICKSKH